MKIITRNQAREAGLNRYFTGVTCKRGHVAERYVSALDCVECARARSQSPEYRAKSQAWNQSPEGKEWRRAYRRTEKVMALAKAYRELPEVKDRLAGYRQLPEVKEKLAEYKKSDKGNAQNSAYKRKKRQEDPNYKMNCAMRSFLKKHFKKAGLTKSERTSKLLGYKPSELVEHLKSQFSEGMTMDNYGEWHIDHIYPIAQFIRDGIDDPAVIHALSNLQPLWADENLRKSDKALKKERP